MLTQTLEIICTMGRNVLEGFALAPFGITQGLAIDWVQVFMLLESVVAEAFSLWANHFAFIALRIFPAYV